MRSDALWPANVPTTRLLEVMLERRCCAGCDYASIVPERLALHRAYCPQWAALEAFVRHMRSPLIGHADS